DISCRTCRSYPQIKCSHGSASPHLQKSACIRVSCRLVIVLIFWSLEPARRTTPSVARDISLYRWWAYCVLGLFTAYSSDHRSGDGFRFSGNQAPPAFVGWLFIILGGGFFLVGQSLAICIIIAGRFLARRK